MQKNNSEIKNICILGASFSTGNMGVSALAQSIVDILSKIYDSVNITFLVPKNKIDLLEGTENVNVRECNYRFSPKSSKESSIYVICFLIFIYFLFPFKRIQRKIINAHGFIKTIFEADVVLDVFGGDSFSDIYGFFDYIKSIIPRFMITAINKNYILLPQTYGPFNKVFTKWTAKKIINRACRVYSRDQESISFLKNILGINKKIQFSPDMAFMLKAKKINLNKSFIDNKKNLLIGLNISGLLYRGGYNENNMFKLSFDYAQVMKNLTLTLIKKGYQILFIPHTYGSSSYNENDRDAINDVIKFLGNKKIENDKFYNIIEDYDQSELKWLISQCDFFIGSRMHACIAAISQGIPAVGIAYSKKFQGVFNSAGIPDLVVDARKESEEILCKEIFRGINKISYYKNFLSASIKGLKNNILDEFSELHNVLEGKKVEN